MEISLRFIPMVDVRRKQFSSAPASYFLSELLTCPFLVEQTHVKLIHIARTAAPSQDWTDGVFSVLPAL